MNSIEDEYINLQNKNIILQNDIIDILNQHIIIQLEINKLIKINNKLNKQIEFLTSNAEIIEHYYENENLIKIKS
jgi:hypothetical protein